LTETVFRYKSGEETREQGSKEESAGIVVVADDEKETEK
jgi:hypothetical protein